MSYFGGNGRADINGPGRFDATERENVIYKNVKHVRKYIYTPGAAVDSDYIEYSLSLLLAGAGTRRAAYGNELPSGFISTHIVASLELVPGNQWEYWVAQKSECLQERQMQTSIKVVFFFFQSSIELSLNLLGRG